MGEIQIRYPEPLIAGRLVTVIFDYTVGPEGMAEDPSSDEPWRLLSGGVDGRVRVWRVTRQHRAMLSSTKDSPASTTPSTGTCACSRRPAPP